ncbi:hypothetical protein [Roseivirga seohaensis]|uniref:hypothetical protein n=1 Tax=Roseivirga seohaensis TaxID=1914963 RepID=UPI003BABB475
MDNTELTRQEIARWSVVEKYNKNLVDNWREEEFVYTKEETKTLVAGNIRGYHAHLLENKLLINSELSGLLERLVLEGGQIVPTSELTENQISIARSQDRMAVDGYGYGFVWFPRANIS